MLFEEEGEVLAIVRMKDVSCNKEVTKDGCNYRWIKLQSWLKEFKGIITPSLCEIKRNRKMNSSVEN